MTDAPPAGLAAHSLLAVFAHPDDESLACGGLLARFADAGVRVSLLCMTRGGHGPGGLGLEGRLDDVRTHELETAAGILGVTDLTILDHQDGMLPWLEAAALEADLRGAIERLRPQAVVTFGEDGLYWHPDHIAVHERTTAAVTALGAEAPALYYVTIPPGAMRAAVDRVMTRRPAGQTAPKVLGIPDPDAFGAMAAEPTLVIDVSAFAARKLAAIRSHRTQLHDDALDLLSDDDAAALLGIEHFRRAQAGSQGDAFLERLRAGARPADPRGGPSTPSTPSSSRTDARHPA